MSLFRGMEISASGLQAERVRMEAIAQNIANAESIGRNGQPYRRKEVVLVAEPSVPAPPFLPKRVAGGVRVAAVREDPSPPIMVYRPGDPWADAQGYVRLSNVNLPLEMVDMVVASRAYEANAAAFRSAREMVRRALDILR